MNSVIVKNDSYTVEPLYQWDKNQTLEITGLSVSSIPEIHFTTDAMDRAIVRQASKSSNGVITVDVPNSLLQKHYTIRAFVCIYEDETFKTLYKIEIPIKARKEPSDYTIENDNEVYSFNALENLVNNTIVEANGKYNEAINNAEQSKTNYNTAKEAYDNATKLYEDFVENNGDMPEMLKSKANKATITVETLLKSGWNNGTYSFEATYPSDTYDIEIAIDSSASSDQVDAFSSAQIVGNANSNIVKAFGDVPSVDIPVIVKAVKI